MLREPIPSEALPNTQTRDLRVKKQVVNHFVTEASIITHYDKLQTVAFARKRRNLVCRISRLATPLYVTKLHLVFQILHSSDISLITYILDINECSNNPCINGKCVDKINSYECDCQPGYEGEKCEKSKKRNFFIWSGITNAVLNSVMSFDNEMTIL